MSLRVYVATAFPEKDRLAVPWMNKLREAGLENTHDWTVTENPPGGETVMPLTEQSFLTTYALNGVRSADVVWVLAPETGGTGCWIEMGYGLALEKYVVVSGPRRTIFTTKANYFTSHE